MTVIILLSEYIFIVFFMLAVHFIVFTVTLFDVLLLSCSGHTCKRDFLISNCLSRLNKINHIQPVS